MQSRNSHRWSLVALFAGSVGLFPWSAWAQTPAHERPKPEVPKLAEASGEAAAAIAGFRTPQGWTTELFASEPMVGNPVAFTIDGRGRVLVCESYRQGVGVTDNRSHDAEWLQADLEAMTVADRIAYHRRLLGDKVAEYESKDDLLRLLIDTDGDHVADTSQIFASGFNGLEEGTGAGVLVRDGKVYYTNIPHLWSLEDRDGDGIAEQRVSLANGFGVRVAFRGHDMHGLVNGPDGRIYFSIGDRGYHVKTPDGLLADPESGAVFRCEPDGSNLELFAVGLRNPQELAFDDFGNLFTGDNNSDSGDRARWVHVVRGGDTGWRMMYQYIPDRGPFNRERIWYPYDENTPAYIVPPIMNLSDGPSGLVSYPGTGLDDSYRNAFFLVDFRGQASNSGIRMIRMEPQGAGFRVTANDEFLWNILATDVDFGPDGAMYVADWVNGWNGENKGRVYRFANPDTSREWIVEETKKVLAEGVRDRNNEELENFLAHPDRRVRQEAQWELARRNQASIFKRVAARTELDPASRLHGVWGLGQIARREASTESQALVGIVLAALCKDNEDRVASKALETLGDSFASRDLEPSLREVIENAVQGGLQSESAMVQAAACMAVGRLRLDGLLPDLLRVIVSNADRDAVLRHCAIMGLTGVSDTERIVKLSQHSNSAVRLAAVVALRKIYHKGIASFLDDESQTVVREAIRAIHDVPQLHSLLGLVADKIVGVPNDDAIVHRVLNANFRLGLAVHAQRLAAFAATAQVDARHRVEALDMLATWAKPGRNDRVMNRFLPLPEREEQPAFDALKSNLERLAAAPDTVRDRFLEVGAQYGINGISNLIEASFADTTNPPGRRAAALLALAGIAPDKVRELLESALSDPQIAVRVAAIKASAKLSPQSTIGIIAKALHSMEQLEQQVAWDTLDQLPASPERDALVADAMRRYLAGDIPSHSRLNAYEAIGKSVTASLRSQWAEVLKKQDDLKVDKPLLHYADSLEGGNIEAGKLLFFTKSSLSCVRCHKVGTTGGEVGPNLSEIGTKKSHEYLLEAIVSPNATVAEGFKTLIIQDEDGSIFSGIVTKEDDENVVLLDAQGTSTTIPVDSIAGRREGQSSMPIDLIKYLNRRELRDLVAYLKSLDGSPKSTAGVFEAVGGHGLE